MTVFTHPFMQHAFLAGTGIALACGLVGYFLVLRAQVFTGDALSHVAFAGALAALSFGIDLRVGLFAATIGVAVMMSGLGRRGRADDAVIGNVFAWILGLGVFFLTLYTTTRSTANSTAGPTVLFGSIFGLSASQATAAVWIGGGIVLALVGATAAEAAQAVGSLLLLGLIAAPAGTALLLTDLPYRGLAISAGLAVAELWAGLALSYTTPSMPPSFAIIAVASCGYVSAMAYSRLRRPRNSNPHLIPATP
jgi:zinc/manganese transport system permease protein